MIQTVSRQIYILLIETAIKQAFKTRKVSMKVEYEMVGGKISTFLFFCVSHCCPNEKQKETQYKHQ